MSVGQQQRLPTLCEVDCQQELVNMAAAVLSAAVNNHNNRDLQQQQLQQQQQQYAILLAQAVQQQQQAANLYSGSMMASHYNSPSPITPNQTSTSTFFQFQHPPASSPAIYHHSPTSSYTQLNPMPGSTSSPHRTAAQSSPFILPLAEPSSNQSGSHDSGLGSAQYLGNAAAAAQVIRRLQLIGEAPDSSGAGASINSLQSSDSDRQRMDSSLESMASGGGGARPSLPTLHQQLEYLRLGSEECRTPSGGTLRRNGPFITRSTSEKVPHRNEILAQVQRTAWARHTTK